MSRTPSTRPWHPFVFEFALATGVLVAVGLWYRLLGTAINTFTGPAGPTLLSGTVPFVALFLGGLLVGAAAYVRVRGVDVGLTLPARSDLDAVATAVVAPAALVGLTTLVGSLTGVTHRDVTGMAVVGDPAFVPVVTLAALSLAVRVPALVVVCQVLLQRGFERASGPVAAVGVTALVAAFAMVDTTGSVGAAPDPGKLVGLVLVALTLALADTVATRSDRAGGRYLAAAPLALVLGVVALDAVVSVTTFAGALYAGTQLATFGVAAAAYRRTGSLLSPALAYASLFVTTRVVAVGAGLS